MRSWRLAVAVLLGIGAVWAGGAVSWAATPGAAAPGTNDVRALYTTRAVATPDTQKCLACHNQMNPNLCMSWERSLHSEKGVGCFECHTANASDSDAIADHNGFTISTLVTPFDCARCHKEQADSFLQSHHAQGGRVLHSLSNFWGEVVEGYGASLNGCQACHGSKVQIDPETKRPLANGYPNHGIGRLNPDGSEGNCMACHQRHDFKMAATRRAEVCGRCHLGPDHPQIEIWLESKHGNSYDDLNRGVDLNARSLTLGKDPIGAPSCYTCHLGATNASGSVSAHDPAIRLSWNLRDAVSVRRENWKEKRQSMESVCNRCHSPTYVKNHFIQLEKAVALYNHKFALPAKKIIDTLKAAGKLDASPVNDKLERDWWHLWHHQGRRARHGVAMMGADFVQWQGFYDVALIFYFEFLPEAERLMPGITKDLLDKSEHQWLRDRISKPEEVKKAIQDSIQFWYDQTPEPPIGSGTPPGQMQERNPGLTIPVASGVGEPVSPSPVASGSEVPPAGK